MRILIFDSGPLINLSMNGLLYLLEDLKKIFDGKFILTEDVKYEVIDRPLKIPRFELGALKIKDLLDKKILELPSSAGIDSSLLKEETESLMKKANTCVKTKNNQVNIISDAEASCLALSSQLTKMKVENLIAIDERTTRILTERPVNLQKLMSKRLHVNVEISCDLNPFSKFRFIRSTELVYVAYKKGLIKINHPKILEALLFATKFKGSSVSYEEINELKKM